MNRAQFVLSVESIPVTPAEVRTKPLILLIDDDNFTRMQIRRFLEREHYQVVEACNGQEGLAAFQQQRPNLVLLDVLMPQMDGLVCCKALQGLLGEQTVPVLMITGLDDAMSIEQVFAAGATDLITKPIHWTVLRQRVQGLLAHQAGGVSAQPSAQKQHQGLDHLTRLVTRNALEAEIAHQWQRNSQDQTHLSIILGDIDFFKSYNDSQGRERGNQCLQTIARVLMGTVCRPGSTVARYGGEEFAILLPQADVSEAVQIGESIRAAIKALNITHPNSLLGGAMTLSLGVSSARPHAIPDLLPETLITTADKALYEAKARGRDRYCVYTVA